MSDASNGNRWEVDTHTLFEMFESAVRKNPDGIYCKSGDLSLSYQDALAAIKGFAARFSPTVRGRNVALVLPNSPAFLIAYFGSLAAGAVPALVNYGHPDATVKKLLRGMDVAAVLSDRTIPGLDILAFSDDDIDELTTAGSGTMTISSPLDAAAILFSGGTTGLPKQIAHTNEMLVAAVERMEWGWPTQEREVWLPVAPFTHIYGFLMGVLNPVLRGGTVVIPPKFQPDLIVDMLRDEAVTVFGGGPPAIYQAIMASSKFETARFPDLRVCPGGGAPFPVAVLERWQKATGLPIMEGYGMTEIAPICVNTASDGARPGAAGKAVPDTVIEIVDIATGDTVLSVGETGEIRVRGPHMMQGYSDNPEETSIAVRHGVVYTGDIGMLDSDGFLVISDRKKDVIFVKGFNVFPREIEEALLAYSSISGACVVGRKDARAGEVPVAYLTTRGPIEGDAVMGFLKDTLAEYKMPAELKVLDAFPMTPAAKVDRSALRAQANEALK